MSRDTADIATMVTQYLPIDTPNCFRDALFNLTRVTRMLSDHHDVCGICLSLALADMLDRAADAGTISHDGNEEHEDAVELTDMMPPTATRQ